METPTPPIHESPFAPEAEDDLPTPLEPNKDEPMEVSTTNEPTPTTIEETNELAGNVEQLHVCRVQQGPQWTNDELYRLVEACELPKSWLVIVLFNFIMTFIGSLVFRV